MKSLFKLFFICLLATAGLGIKAQCITPDFTYTIAPGGVVTFYDNNYYDSIPGGVYIWRFGDGDTTHTSSYQFNHTYTAAGTYTASLEFVNAGTGCDQVTSQTFHLGLCQGAAQFSISNEVGFGDFIFDNKKLALLPGATIAWDFGDGTTSTSDSLLHRYTTNGTYNITDIVTDATLGCTDTFIFGNMGVNICNYNLLIDTNILSFNPERIQFKPSTLNAGYTYNWNFGDGGSAATEIATHSFVSSNFYTVSLTVSDAVTSCSLTITGDVKVDLCGVFGDFGNGGNGLTQNFSAYALDSTNTVISGYVWSFPGATPATGSGSQLSGIVYPATGTYSACVYLSTTSGCIDTICKPVIITSPTYTISGAISKLGGNGFIGTAYLIAQDSIGHLILLDSTTTNYDSVGVFNYAFYNLPVDTYYVKAALSAADQDYAGYMPTYYGDVLNWGTATPVIITNSNINNIDISLIAGSNSGGPGFLGGYVTQGAGLVIGNTGNNNARSVGDPLKGLQINLLTSANQAVAYTFSDINGHYSFPNLALGAYKIYVEQLNKKPSPLEFTLTAENPVDSSVDMSVNSNSATGINDLANLQISEVYPNPVITTVQLQISCKQATDAVLKVVDVLGRTALEQKEKFVSGENTSVVNMAKLPAGIYQLVIQTNTSQVTYKLVKAK